MKKKSLRHVAAGHKGGCTRWRRHREPTLKDYLLARISVKKSGCWEWLLGKDKDGYGHAAYKGKGMSAHRASFKAFKGPLLKGKLIRHKCDNTSCINPEHLIQGTHKENMQDMYERNLVGVERIRRSSRKTGLKYGKRRFSKMSREGHRILSSKAAIARWSKMSIKERKLALIDVTHARLAKQKKVNAI
jgi:hypothetical protein